MHGRRPRAVVLLTTLVLVGTGLATATLWRQVPGPIDATRGLLKQLTDLSLPIGMVVLVVALGGVVLRVLLLEHADRVVRGLRGEDDAEVVLEAARPAAAPAPPARPVADDAPFRRPSTDQP